MKKRNIVCRGNFFIDVDDVIAGTIVEDNATINHSEGKVWLKNMQEPIIFNGKYGEVSEYIREIYGAMR